MKKKIAIIAGGDSHEREISLKSAQTVLDNIDKELFDAHLVLLTKNEWICHYHKVEIPINRADFCLDVDGQHFHFDAAFITIHGTPGEDGLLQAYFNLLDIPYTTTNHSEATLTFNKWMCNHLLNSLGYACAKSILLRENHKIDVDLIVASLGLPCFVKPNDSGSSYGVKKVNQKEELKEAILHAFKHGNQVLIESYLDGIEVTNGVFTEKGEIIVLPITEIVTDNDFFDYEAKYGGKSTEITPARLDDDISCLIQRMSKDIYHDLGLKGMIRIDYMIVNDVPYVIEINTTPGLSEQSVIPKQASAIGITLKKLFTIVIQEALNY
tara:strand:- start:1280 stop:2254 length:975 start_codon:yes stop_codon:yes gene_type:complete